MLSPPAAHLLCGRWGFVLSHADKKTKTNCDFYLDRHLLTEPSLKVKLCAVAILHLRCETPPPLQRKTQLTSIIGQVIFLVRYLCRDKTDGLQLAASATGESQRETESRGKLHTRKSERQNDTFN